MMGKLSDLPMMRAASMPQRGQTTPTAALVRLAIDLAPVPLDAGNATAVSGLPPLPDKGATDPITGVFLAGIIVGLTHLSVAISASLALRRAGFTQKCARTTPDNAEPRT